MVYDEELIPIPVGLGINSFDHPANLEEGFTQQAENLIAHGDRLVSRKGFSPPDTFDSRTDYTFGTGFTTRMVRLPNSSNETWPVALYGGIGDTIALRQFNRDSPSNTNELSESTARFSFGNFRGACTYLDRIYIYTTTNALEYHTNWNWSAGTTTANAVAGAPTGSARGLFIFKDRMWMWDETKIYYTDVPATPGAYPEVWNATANFLVINAEAGMGQILSIIPSNTKLFVITTAGLFTISVVGTPANWVVRLLDSRVQANHQNCAFEDQGLVYFVDTRGVWVTNGADVKKISENIEDVFQKGDNEEIYFYYKLMPFEEGFLLVKQKVSIEGSWPGRLNKVEPEADIFYTRLDFIAWTKFTFGTASQPVDIIAAFPHLETYFLWERRSYLVLAHGQNNEDHTHQLLAYQGWQDTLRELATASESAPVSGLFETRVIRGQMFQTKRAKYAYINLSAEDASLPENFDIDYSWETEHQAALGSGSVSNAMLSTRESIVKISAAFMYRYLIGTITFTLATGARQYTFLGLGIINHTDRRESRTVS